MPIICEALNMRLCWIRDLEEGVFNELIMRSMRTFALILYQLFLLPYHHKWHPTNSMYIRNLKFQWWAIGTGIWKIFLESLVWLLRTIPKTNSIITNNLIFKLNYFIVFLITTSLFFPIQQHEYEKNKINMYLFMSMKWILI